MGLLDQALGKNTEAWTTISRVYAPLVYAWARRKGLSDSDASDVTQDVFLKIYQKLDTYTSELGKFRGWLWTITDNVIKEFFRKHDQRPTLVGQRRLEAHPDQVDQEPAEADPTRIPNEIIRRALEIIRPQFREQTFQAAWRTLALGLDPKLVAIGLNMSVAAVYTAKCRVLKGLKQILDGLEF